MKNIPLIVALFFALNASGQGGFFWSHTLISSSSACKRPTGLANKVFWEIVTIGGVYINITGSFNDAANGWYKAGYNNNLLWGEYVEAASFAVGDSVYAGISRTDCTKMPNGYYLDRVSSGNRYNDLVIHVVGGVIVSAQSPLTIGTPMGGGLLSYILASDDPGYSTTLPRGIIAASADETSLYWGPNSITGALGTALGTGPNNTDGIVYVYGAGSYAAWPCYDKTTGGYTDWFLPSTTEMIKITLQAAVIGITNSYNTRYWTSTEQNTTNAYFVDTYAVTTGADGKSAVYKVRAIRLF